MKFLDYIAGRRRGKDAHRIEKDSMLDPFLYEAIEGFDSVNDNHIERINAIQSRINTKSKSKSFARRLWQIAATVAILILGFGGYLFIDYHKSTLYAQEPEQTIIDIYVPEAFYAENITTIAKRNAEVVREYKPEVSISRFKPEEKVNPSLSKEELDILSEADITSKEETSIEIYAPKDMKADVLETEPLRIGKPEPFGGYDKFNEYLKKSLRRPTDDMCKDRQGKVAVEFSVDEYGRPYLFEVRQSLCGTSDNEAIRLLKEGPRWTRGTERVMVRVIF